MDKAELKYQIGEVLSYSKWSHQHFAEITTYYFIVDYLEESKDYLIDSFSTKEPLCVHYKEHELDQYFQRVK